MKKKPILSKRGDREDRLRLAWANKFKRPLIYPAHRQAGEP